LVADCGKLTFQFRYWQFILSLFIGLTVCELILAPMHGVYPIYSSFVGYAGLAIEATLPLPQILANRRLRSCKGFRFSVLVSWLVGDAMKMAWFFTSSTTIPWAFKICGIFQAFCDSFLGVQYLMYGSGPSLPAVIKEHPLSEWPESQNPFANPNPHSSGRDTPLGRRISATEKKI
jgi:solute carrier family 66, member 2